MKSRLMMTLICAALIGCGANYRYPNWEYVRLEQSVPDPGCLYQMQESCSLPTNQCYNWHKQRAVTFNANTVVITNQQNLDQAARSGWTGNAKSGQNVATIAEYYSCSGPKNIKPVTQ